MTDKVLVAMSGGVDSSVAAFLLKQNNYNLMGVTMKLYNNEDVGIKEKTCCSLSDIEDARFVARKIGISYHVFNFSDDFKEKVIDKFVNSYLNGITPNPCIDCNRYIKWKRLFERAKTLQYNYVATGHYARIEKQNDRFLLKKGIDDTKDQSYVLYNMTQYELSHTLFPLGNIPKTKVREIALENSFINAKKHDSQDICFVQDETVYEFIKRYTNKEFETGNAVDMQGNILGKHKGIGNYTIGQRKGLGFSLEKPMYVCKICPQNNTIVLGENEDLMSKSLDATDINLIACDKIEGKIRINAKVRYNHSGETGYAWQSEDNRLHVEFDNPVRAITKGQALVMYDGDVVIGGGTII